MTAFVREPAHSTPNTTPADERTDRSKVGKVVETSVLIHRKANGSLRLSPDLETHTFALKEAEHPILPR